MKPIIFSTDMVKAILEGRKTQTRRVIKLKEFQKSDTKGYDFIFRDKRMLWNDYREKEFIEKKCPYGKIGDRLWVRETWCKGYEAFVYRPPNYYYKVDNAHGDIYIRGNAINDRGKKIKWRSPRFMPKDASRLTLEITDIKVERVQDIGEGDSEKEGVDSIRSIYDIFSFKDAFKNLWNHINKKRGYGWDENPWVWVIEFKVKEQADG